MTIWFDMDGTIADLYAVNDWLPKLRASDPSPYAEAEVMMNMSLLARYLNKLSAKGISIGIISWTSKTGTAEYNEAVASAKMGWLAEHLHSVMFDAVHVVEYGTPKSTFRESPDDILFDDEERNRVEWGTDTAFSPDEIMKVLKEIDWGE